MYGIYTLLKIVCPRNTLKWRVSKLIFAHAENDHFQFEGNRAAWRQPDGSKQLTV